MNMSLFIWIRNVWIRHGTYDWVTSNINASSHIWTSRFTYEWVTSRTNESRHTYKWVMAHMRIWVKCETLQPRSRAVEYLNFRAFDKLPAKSSLCFFWNIYYWGVAVCCSMLQGVAGWCRVLQGVAGCCRVLQRAGVGWSVLQHVAVYKIRVNIIHYNTKIMRISMLHWYTHNQHSTHIR